MQKLPHGRTTASFFQTKDTITCQLQCGTIQRYILMRVMINKITAERFLKNIAMLYHSSMGATSSATSFHLI